MTIEEAIPTQTNSTGWLTFVKITFCTSLLSMGAFIFLMDSELLVKGFMALNSLFIVSSTIIFSKTLRDEHENKRLFNRIEEAKNHKILKEFTE